MSPKVCKGCSKRVEGWQTLVTAKDGPEAGDYHKGCFDEMARKYHRAQWTLMFDQPNGYGEQPNIAQR